MILFSEAFWAEWEFEFFMLEESLPALGIYFLLYVAKKINDRKKANHRQFWKKNIFSDN